MRGCPVTHKERQCPGSRLTGDEFFRGAVLQRASGELREGSTPDSGWYGRLHALASGRLRHEGPGHALQTTAVVHEAYLRLASSPALSDPSTPEFAGLAARVIRNVLVDQARRRRAEKRGGGAPPARLDTAVLEVDRPEVDVLELDDALERLAALDERQARVVELRFFGNLAMTEIAALLGVARATVDRDWRWARAWLRRELARGSCAGET